MNETASQMMLKPNQYCRSRSPRRLPLAFFVTFVALFTLCGTEALPAYAQQQRSGPNQETKQADEQKFTRTIEVQLSRIPFDGRSAFSHLKNICDIGPRISGSEGMLKQRDYLTSHFEELGAKVSLQSFPVRHPETGEAVEIANMIVQWHPEKRNRILFCTHFDTRPFADRDPHNPRGEFIGANDGASGVALLCELGKLMPALNGKIGDGSIGVDFVFFDAEEFIFQRVGGEYFVGSTYFARDYIANPPDYRYSYGILLDMVADAELNLYFEKHSMKHAEKLTRSIWHVARELRVTEFVPRTRHRVNDDHLPLNNIARIPTCDIIDFDYPRPGGKLSYWHTQQDSIENCSPVSLAKVGWVLHQWLLELK